jgi:arginine decarboxylase-like protein
MDQLSDQLRDISLESRKPLLLSLMTDETSKEANVIETFSKSTRSSHDAWRLFSKAKHALEDGARLENLSWRLFYLKVHFNLNVA